MYLTAPKARRILICMVIWILYYVHWWMSCSCLCY